MLGGVKFPTGRNDVMNSAGERVEPSATAGSGSYDGMLGVAYSHFLTSRVTLDASAQYTLRSEANGFRLGDRVDAGLTVSSPLPVLQNLNGEQLKTQYKVSAALTVSF